MERDQLVKKMRPEPKGRLLKTGEDEKFNYNVLLPILEMQREIVREIFAEYVNEDHSGFAGMPVDRKILFAANKVNNDVPLKKILQGVVIGNLTRAEYKQYVSSRDILEPRLTAGLVRVISDSFMG